MPSRHAICLIIDGLRASALGAYGGGGVATPALDRMAGESIVADWLWTAGPTVESFYNAIATGAHPLRLLSAAEEPMGDEFFAALMQADVRLDLITDDATVAHQLGATEKVDVQLLDLPAAELAPTVEETRFAQLLAVAAEHWLSAEFGGEQRILWIHAAGWHGPWDAPLAIREALLAEDDLRPSTAVDVSIDPGAKDPDELLIGRTAYAAQTAVLDECLDGFLSAVNACNVATETLLVLGGARGLALGEHGQFGRQRRPCYSEFLHTPLLVRPPETSTPRPRDNALRSPCDIAATLVDWLLPTESRETIDGRSLLAGAVGQSTPGGRRWNVSLGDDDLALRTPAWMLRQSGHGDSGDMADVELYAKPDDRWEANEIANRCPDVVDAAVALLAELKATAARGESFDQVSLADLLLDVRH